MLKVFRKIPSHYPKAWVTGILLWLASLIGMALAALCLLINWQLGYYIAFALVGAGVIAFMGCIVWFFLERLTGRVTPWRREA